MSWDDDDDAFYEGIDWESQVQQARARRQQNTAPASETSRLGVAQQPGQHPSGHPAAGPLRLLFTGAQGGAAPAAALVPPAGNQAPGPAQHPSQQQEQWRMEVPSRGQWASGPQQQRQRQTGSLPPTGQQLGAPQHLNLQQQQQRNMELPPGAQWRNAPQHVQHAAHPRQQGAYQQAPQHMQQQPHQGSIGRDDGPGYQAGAPGQTRGPGGATHFPPQLQGHGGPPQPHMQRQMPQQFAGQQPQHGQLPNQHPQQQQQQQQQRASGGSGTGHMGPCSGHAPALASSGQGSGPLLYVNLELGKDQLIQVKCGYHEAISAALKRLPGAEWDSKARQWRLPIAQHDRIVQTLQGLRGVRVKLEPLQPIVSSVLRAAAGNPDDSDRYCHIPSNLEQQLMPFQREGVKFALRHGGRALIGDEMGLGKTVQAIAVAAAYRDEWPVLIIAPSSLREAWADALHRWLGITDDKLHIVHTNKDAKAVPQNIQVLIISYNFVQKMDLDKQFRIIILDESHFIKDPGAQRTKATVPLVKSARRAILLSGTPALNKPKEIFQQLAALVPAAKLKMKDFGERYCLGNHFDRYGGASNLSELNALLKNSIMVRRLKGEVLQQLPTKRRQQVILGLDDDAKKALAGLQHKLEVARQIMGEEAKKAIASGGAAGPRMQDGAAISELYVKSAEIKKKAVQDYVQLLLDNKQKFLVFAHHSSLMDAIEHTCNRHKGCKFIRIDGKTPPSQRQSLVNSFQENDDIRVAILSIRAAGTGLTLTAASTVVFAEMTWVPGEICQAEDRAHRIGQACSVNVYFLHARGSIDDLIWQSIQNKLDAVGEAIDGQAQALDAKRMEAPERGQTTLQTYLTQSKPGEGKTADVRAPPAPPQQGQAGLGAGRPGGSSGGGASPGKAQQSSLLNFFARQPAAQPQRNGQPLALQQQQQQQPAMPPPRQQYQQQPAGRPLAQQYEQQHAGPPHSSCQQQYPQQQYPQQLPLGENAGQQRWQQQQQQPQCLNQGGVPPPAALHAPSGMANVPQAVGHAQGKLASVPPGQQQQLAGSKRPYEGH